MAAESEIKKPRNAEDFTFTFASLYGKIKHGTLELIPSIYESYDLYKELPSKRLTHIKSTDSDGKVTLTHINDHPMWNDPGIVKAIMYETIDFHHYYDFYRYPCTPTVEMAFARAGIMPRKFTQDNIAVYIKRDVPDNIRKVPVELTTEDQWLWWIKLMYDVFDLNNVPEQFHTERIREVISERCAARNATAPAT